VAILVLKTISEISKLKKKTQKRQPKVIQIQKVIEIVTESPSKNNTSRHVINICQKTNPLNVAILVLKTILGI
jgi:hypothetical protein